MEHIKLVKNFLIKPFVQADKLDFATLMLEKRTLTTATKKKQSVFWFNIAEQSNFSALIGKTIFLKRYKYQIKYVNLKKTQNIFIYLETLRIFFSMGDFEISC